MARVIGLDLDNTLVGYEELFPAAALELGLFTPEELAELPPGKTALRDALRARPGGEYQWRDVQALVYGREILRAEPFPGVREFLARCRELDLPVFVVSHKTPTASCRGREYDLRAAALAWLEKAGLFDPAASPLTRERVFFESTRAGKLARIQALGCAVFVDDLVELFLEPEFPPGVAQVLFDPTGKGHPEFRGALARSWAEAAERVLGGTEGPDQTLAARAGELLESRVAGSRRIFAGGNSRVWDMTLEDGRRCALKHYFRHADDPRDRLGVEFGALTRLWDAGIPELRAAIPRPLAAAPELGLALYDFVQGEAVSAPGEGELAQAVAFLGLLRRAGSSFAGFPWASDACVSGAHLTGRVAARLTALEEAGQAPEATSAPGAFRDMGAFVSGPLREMLSRVEERGQALLGPDWGRELPEAGRVPSPSDFGFHNAMRKADGRVVFLDFEYFGWDDPAKLVSDFLVHPRNPLPAQLKTCFLKQSLELYGDLPGAGSRLLALYPLVGLAWCAIMLNVFSRASLERREFAGAGWAHGTREALLAAQLGKARSLHEGLERWLRETRELQSLTPAGAGLFPHAAPPTGSHTG